VGGTAPDTDGKPRERRVVNIDADPNNADWIKHPRDLPGVHDAETLRQYLATVGMTIEHFKTLPIYQRNVNKPGMEWLRDLR
jgi:hypothetical protein